MADLAEVRGRLANVQRFDGYSGWAAAASGAVAIAAGFVQLTLVPHPVSPADKLAYLTIWLLCLGFALAINYGAILVWRARTANVQAGVQIRTVGISLVPAIAAGGVITAALVIRGLHHLLPGMWCATYALGLFASRAMGPRQVIWVAAGFGAVATALLLLVNFETLTWWTMPLAFGAGQIAIGGSGRVETRHERSARL